MPPALVPEWNSFIQGRASDTFWGDRALSVERVLLSKYCTYCNYSTCSIQTSTQRIQKLHALWYLKNQPKLVFMLVEPSLGIKILQTRHVDCIYALGAVPCMYNTHGMSMYINVSAPRAAHIVALVLLAVVCTCTSKPGFKPHRLRHSVTPSPSSPSVYISPPPHINGKIPLASITNRAASAFILSPSNRLFCT